MRSSDQSSLPPFSLSTGGGEPVVYYWQQSLSQDSPPLSKRKVRLGEILQKNSRTSLILIYIHISINCKRCDFFFFFGICSYCFIFYISQILQSCSPRPKIKEFQSRQKTMAAIKIKSTMSIKLVVCTKQLRLR